MEHTDIVEHLKKLGFPAQSKRVMRLLDLIGVMMSIQGSPPRALRFGEIFQAIRKSTMLKNVTRAKLHQYLNDLIDLKIIHAQNTQASRRRYVIDVNTITEGIENIRDRTLVKLNAQIKSINEQILYLKEMDCSKLAEEMIYSLVGKKTTMTTRFAKGIDGMHQLLLNNIILPAKKGDIIRASAMFIGSLIEGGVERTEKFVEAAKKGVIIKYLVSSDVFSMVEKHNDVTNREGFVKLVRHIHEVNKEGIGSFEIRFRHGPRTYNHITLNSERVALILTENPITTTLVTRQFNSDLIDNVVKEFDESWSKAITIPQAISVMSEGFLKDNPLIYALKSVKEGGED